MVSLRILRVLNVRDGDPLHLIGLVGMIDDGPVLVHQEGISLLRVTVVQHVDQLVDKAVDGEYAKEFSLLGVNDL